MVNIPKFYKTEEYNIYDVEGNEHTIEIGEYKAADMPYVLKLQELLLELPGLLSKAKMFREIVAPAIEKAGEDITEEKFINSIMSKAQEFKEEDFSPEDIEDVKKAYADVQKLEAEKIIYSEKLAQRGLKRFYFRDDPEFIDAKKEDRLTEYLDSLEDIPLNVKDLEAISLIMMKLGAPNQNIRKIGKGKRTPKI